MIRLMIDAGGVKPHQRQEFRAPGANCAGGRPTMRWLRGDPRRRAAGAQQYGVQAAAQGRFRRAARLFARAVKLCPDWPEARINLGSAYYQLALHDREELALTWLRAAEAQFRTAHELDPGSPAAVLDLCATLNALGQPDEALTRLRDLAGRHPHHRDLHYNLAVGYLQQGDPSQARRELAHELEHHPDHAAALRMLERLR
jgi:tetratricopeptide (TPR) repeat protein